VQYKNIPVIAAVIGPTTLTESSMAGLSHAVKIFGATSTTSQTIKQVTGAWRVIVDALIVLNEQLTQVEGVLRKSGASGA
jgi:hypothetical protein